LAPSEFGVRWYIKKARDWETEEEDMKLFPRETKRGDVPFDQEGRVG